MIENIRKTLFYDSEKHWKSSILNFSTQKLINLFKKIYVFRICIREKNVFFHLRLLKSTKKDCINFIIFASSKKILSSFLHTCLNYLNSTVEKKTVVKKFINNNQLIIQQLTRSPLQIHKYQRNNQKNLKIETHFLGFDFFNNFQRS